VVAAAANGAGREGRGILIQRDNRAGERGARKTARSRP